MFVADSCFVSNFHLALKHERRVKFLVCEREGETDREKEEPGQSKLQGERGVTEEHHWQLIKLQLAVLSYETPEVACLNPQTK